MSVDEGREHYPGALTPIGKQHTASSDAATEGAAIHGDETGMVLRRFIDESMKLVEFYWPANGNCDSFNPDVPTKQGVSSSLDFVSHLRHRLECAPTDDPARSHWEHVLMHAEMILADWLVWRHNDGARPDQMLFGTALDLARDCIFTDEDEALFWVRHMRYALPNVFALLDDHRYETKLVHGRIEPGDRPWGETPAPAQRDSE